MSLQGVPRVNNGCVQYTGLTALGEAVTKGNLQIVQVFCEKFPQSVNDQDNSGNTAMHYAVAKWNIAIMQALLDTGHVDLQIHNNGGQKPINVLSDGMLYCEGIAATT